LSEFPYDSAIIATVISVAISLVVLAYREKKLEPDKWKKNAKLATMDKQLEAYGSLLTILHACEGKATRQQINENTEFTHLLEVPKDSENLRSLIMVKRYLLSEKIVDEYLKMEKGDTYFALTPKEGKSSTLLINLREMQDIVEYHFISLKDDYKKLTGYEL
jgi:hypothetical protein